MRIEKLGAHLEAYVDTLPVITSLRLCHRYGKGANSYIYKLPIELVGIIEQFVVEPEREKHLATWSKEPKCRNKECKMHDHFTPEEHEVFGAHHGCMRQGCEDEAHTTFGKPHGHACLGRGRCALAHSASYEEAVISMSQKLYGQT